MKPGTIVKLPDGRIGTVVYHGLDGYGIMWGEIAVDVEKIESQNPITGTAPDDFEYKPEAMLRDPYPSAIRDGIECVGEDYERIDY